MTTSLDQNFSDLANILMQRRQMQNQQAQQDRANRLSDLQYKQLQREDDYQTGLQGAMASPGVITSRQIAPNPQPSLANLMPGNQIQPPQFEQPGPQVGPLASRVQTTETPRSAAAAGAEYALGKGRFEDAVKLLSVDDHVAQLKAKGDLPSYYQAQRELEEGNKFFDIISKYKANPEQLKMLWPQVQRLFPKQSAGITPDDVQFKGKSVLLPLEMNGQIVPNKGVFRDEQGKTSIVDLTPKEQPVGKPFSRDYEEGDTKVTELYDAQGKLTGTKKAPRYKPAASNTGGGDDADVDAWAKAVREGRATLQDVPNRGTVRSRVVKAIERGGGVDYAANSADNKAYAGSVAQQQKQLGSMGSFVRNLSAQIDRVGQIGAELNTFDSRLLNVPLRAARARIAGSPMQAKYDMYLAEIESEIGKLSTGSTGSVAELSQGAQERWAKIHDKNLSVNDMLQLLKETKHAGELRMKSVKDQLDETRAERQNRGKPSTSTVTKGGFKVTVVK